MPKRYFAGRQVQILSYILEQKEVTIKDLIERFELDYYNCYRQLSVLTEKELIRRKGDLWVLTERGERERRRYQEEIKQVEDNEKLSMLFWAGLAVLILWALSKEAKEES